MGSSVLITGSEGFVGKVLAKHLTEHGDTVLGCDLNVPEAEDRHACDVTNRDSVAEALAWAGSIDTIYHLAAITFVPTADAHPTQVMDVNLNGTINLVHAVRKQCPRTRIVFVGSSQVYGAPETCPISEAYPLEPANPYAISKAAADGFCAYAAKAWDLDIVRVRPFNHTGPGQPTNFVLPSFAHQVAQIEAAMIAPELKVGNLDVARDFSHVDDVVNAYRLIAEQGVSGEVYNVCSGRAYSLRAAIERLRELANVDFDVVTDPDRTRAVDIPEIWGSHDKLTTLTGWQPKHSFDGLMEELLDYWRKKKWG